MPFFGSNRDIASTYGSPSVDVRADCEQLFVNTKRHDAAAWQPRQRCLGEASLFVAGVVDRRGAGKQRPDGHAQ